jgi:hypothetical protein
MIKRSRATRRKSGREKPIRTSFIELIQELSSLTNDDSLVVAAVKSIFDSYRVRLSRSSAPIRLVGAEIPLRANRRSAWHKENGACA